MQQQRCAHCGAVISNQDSAVTKDGKMYCCSECASAEAK
jgi:Prokaryotic metallothionein